MGVEGPETFMHPETRRGNPQRRWSARFNDRGECNGGRTGPGGRARRLNACVENVSTTGPCCARTATTFPHAYVRGCRNCETGQQLWSMLTAGAEERSAADRPMKRDEQGKPGVGRGATIDERAAAVENRKFTLSFLAGAVARSHAAPLPAHSAGKQAARR